MYRVNTWEDLNSTAFFDYLNSNGVIAVEWSENVENALPVNYIRVDLIAGRNSEERRIIITEVNRLENACD
jgi:tRNA threonylcarbamoyladenosine biosynthesis protein TsaE